MKNQIKLPVQKIEKIKTQQATMRPESVKTPTHFPCAARVKMPQLGSEDSEIKIRKPPLRSSMMLYRSSDLSQLPVQDGYVKRISRGLSFEEDVVKDRCFHALPYDSKYFWEVLAPGDLVPLPPKARIPVGRHNPRGTDIRHIPCGITKIAKSHPLKPLKRKIMERAMEMHKQALAAEKEAICSEHERGSSDVEELPSEQIVFITEIPQEDREIKSKLTVQTSGVSGERIKFKSKSAVADHRRLGQAVDIGVTSSQDLSIQRRSPSKIVSLLTADQLSESPKKNDWDAYLLSILSPLTANWVVHERMSPSEDKTNLSSVLKEWYGKPEHTDLIRDDVSVTDLELEPQKDKKKSKEKEPKEMSFFEKVKAEVPKRAVDPYSDDNDAPFYRQPAGLRRQRKTEEKEEAGAINATARDIAVKEYQASPPPTLRDFINPAVGDKMYDTDNMFQQEWLAGSRQAYHPSDNTKIVMESNNKYKKQLQKEYPPSSERWFPGVDGEKGKMQDDHRLYKGRRRWTGLPEPVDDTSEILNIVPPGYDPEFYRSPDPMTRRLTKQNASLMQIISEWRNKWQLSGQYADSSPMDLVRDMADIQPHVRLKAIATVAKAAEYKPPAEAGIQLEYKERQNDVISQLSDDVFVALNYLLEDEHDRVRKAAAITLYSLNRPSDKAETVLREALSGDNSLDRWTAAQCLAHFGVCDSEVVHEIIAQLLDTEDSIKHEQAITLLSKISNNTNLVHSMVAEQLNSCSWRHKVIACKILPTLHGTINKDISNKLSELMWNDWHVDVRRAAAQCLGKTQHGRDVHDDLVTRITSSNERIRLEAISRIGQLGIMTAKLLPGFLKCLEDSYVSVRIEACITCGNLQIQDEHVLEKLVYLATYDSIWKVKAIAIQALGAIGVTNDDIRDCLLWALRYEEKEGVRAEACHSLIKLKHMEQDFAEILQDRLLVETSEIVREEILEALHLIGVSTTEDMDMVAQVKAEVRKLCHRDIIASQIMVNEMDEDRKENLKRMICETNKEIERFFMGRHRFQNLISVFDLESSILKMHGPTTVEARYQEHKAKSDSALKKIRALSSIARTHPSSGSLASLHSREGTMFTPSADKELEALIGPDDFKEEEVSDSLSPITGSAKSRAGTGTSRSRSRPATGARSETLSSRSESRLSEASQKTRERSAASAQSITESSYDTQDETFTDSGTHPELNLGQREMSNVSDLNVKDPSSQMMTKVQGLTISGEDIRASRMSVIGPPSERKLLLSRETVKEREKVSTEAFNTYTELDSRYASFQEDVTGLDFGQSILAEQVDDTKIAGVKPASPGSSKLESVAVMEKKDLDVPVVEVSVFQDNDAVEDQENTPHSLVSSEAVAAVTTFNLDEAPIIGQDDQPDVSVQELPEEMEDDSQVKGHTVTFFVTEAESDVEEEEDYVPRLPGSEDARAACSETTVADSDVKDEDDGVPKMPEAEDVGSPASTESKSKATTDVSADQTSVAGESAEAAPESISVPPGEKEVLSTELEGPEEPDKK